MQNEAGTEAATNLPQVDAAAEQYATVAAILKAKAARGASWFYWIAGLSLINLFAIIGNTDFRFVFGLGVSEFLGEWAKQAATNGSGSSDVAIAAGGSLAMTAFFALCGRFAHRPSVPAFVIGTLVFALDSLVFVVVKDWVAVAFHAYAIYALWQGFNAARQYKSLNA